MVKNYKFIFGILILLVSSIVHSSEFDFQSCKVIEVVIAGDKNAHVQMDCSVSIRPACAVSYTYFGFDNSTEKGKQYLSVILTAFASGSLVTGFVDDNQCMATQGNVALLTHIRMTTN